MWYRIARVVVTAVLVALAWPMWAQTRSERLVAGEQKTFKPAYAVGDIAIANPAVCDYRVLAGRREVMLVAVQTGFTTLTIWDQRGTKRDEVAIEVVSREFARILADMTELLRPFPKVVIKPLGDRAVLTGTVETPDELQTITTLAGAAGNVVCAVTLRQGAAPGNVPSPPATVSALPPAGAPSPLQPLAPTITHDPEPPAPVRRTPVTTPPPVPLGTLPPPPAAMPQPMGAIPPDSAPPVAVAAEATPPPPNIAPAPPTAPAGQPAQPVGTPSPAPAPGTGRNAPAGSGAVEYLIEIYESPASAPPPEVAGPQGKRLYSGRVRSNPGVEIRRLIKLAGGNSASSMRGLSIGLTPTLVDNDIHTNVIVDTNLPVGNYDQKNPVWLRCALEFTSGSGQARFIPEVELASSAAPASAAPSPGTSDADVGRFVGEVVDTGAAVAGAVTGVSIPSFGGLLSSSPGATQPKARKTTLLIVVTPSILKPSPEAESTHERWR